MIKIVRAEHLEAFSIRLSFSDGTEGVFDAAASLLPKKGTLIEPLRNPDYFRRFFLELGALCWKNGLELSPSALHRDLSEQGKLSSARHAA
ncbi:MAG: DUF2442 domain-containing protein [Betaproteobacteria bacterium]|nr:DUF2442 domain-containing protein [Betaproteobacteria bacterium]